MLNASSAGQRAGALVISLDFELQWGVRERTRDGGYAGNLAGARRAIPRMLDLFAEFDVAATWATVGFLFAESREELEHFRPARRPGYADPALDPYDDPLGEGEADDPFHFAPSLVRAILDTPRQELATHTYSHYYCQEPGQDAEAFRADLTAATAIAASRGVRLRSIVFPRNQHNPAYDGILREHGIVAYRGNPRTWMWRFDGTRQSGAWTKRLGRAVSIYRRVSERETLRWTDLVQPSGLADVRASRFLAPVRPGLPYLERVRARSIGEALWLAAVSGRVLHLWWHPHNFGAHVDESLALLRSILVAFDQCRSGWGLRSLSMAEAAETARRALPTAAGRSVATAATV